MVDKMTEVHILNLFTIGLSVDTFIEVPDFFRGHRRKLDFLSVYSFKFN